LTDGPQPGVDYAPVSINVSIGVPPEELDSFIARGKELEAAVTRAFEDQLGRKSGPEFNLTVSVSAGTVFQTTYFFPPHNPPAED